jgi:membrane protein
LNRQRPADQPARLAPLDEASAAAPDLVPPEKLPYHERLRGRAARTPVEIGWRGWWDIAVRVAERVGIDNLGLITAGVTFYVFLALIPALIAMVSFYGMVADTVTLDAHVSFLSGYLPDQALEWIAGEITRIGELHENGLTLALVAGLGISLWSMNNAVIALFGAMNIAYGEVEKRGTISLYLRAFTVTIAALVVGLVMIGAIVVVPLIMGSDTLDYGGRRVTAPVLFCVVALGSAAIYRLGWLAVSTLLSWYLSNIANYAVVYGSLGTVIALMFWFYISVFIVLLGAELAAETEHQTMVDTTVGPERPMGRRGAYVADTVGRKAGG